MRLRVKIRNSKDCRTELPFPDLCIKYSNGFSPALKVKEGEEIQLTVCDPEDVRKSLLVGSLRGYLDTGWIEEIRSDDQLKDVDSPVRISQFITERMVLVPEVITSLKSLEQEVSTPNKETPATPILPETKEVDNCQTSTVKIEQITDLTLIKTYEDFNTLSHFLKLQFIRDSNDMILLKDILGKTPSSQFKNNINLRLTKIK